MTIPSFFFYVYFSILPFFACAISKKGKKFSLPHIVQNGSGVHPTFYKLGTGGCFQGTKRQGRESDHSPPTSAEVKKMWIYTSTPLCVFMA
jgi:hypothetical protein